MSAVLKSFIFFLLVVFRFPQFQFSKCCFAQESQTENEKANSETAKAKSGFEWLKQFEGSWQSVTNVPTQDGSPAKTQKGSMKSASVGKQWVVNKFDGEIDGTSFQAVQTLGYDVEKKRFVGTWIDSVASYTWKYEGEVDATGKKLTLNAEGPDWNDPKITRRFRDVYEFKSATEIAVQSQMFNDKKEWETYMTGSMTKSDESTRPRVTPFLMFIGRAEEAINHYKDVFGDVQIESMNKYKAGESGKEGTIQLAEIVIAGQRVKCIDSPAVHDFDFTPSFSFFVDCENAEQLKERFDKLADGGKVMMPINNYGFSQKFGWVSDKFGVSWQLNLK